METSKKINIIKIDFICSKCNIGYLRPTGEVLLSLPPKYPHKCNKCDYKETFNLTYPYYKEDELNENI